MKNAQLLTLALFGGLAACSSSKRTTVFFDPDTGTVDVGVDTGSPVDGSVDTGSPADAGHDTAPGDALSDGDANKADSARSDGGDAQVDSAIAEAGPADGSLTPPGDAATAAICPTTFTQANTATIAELCTAKDDLFSSMSLDERTIAWLVPQTSGAAVYTAEMNATADYYVTPPSTVPPPAGGFGLDRVAVSPDGLRLVFVTSAGHLAEYVRANRTVGFAGPASETPYSAANALAGDASKRLGSPVIGGDDTTLYFVVVDAAGGVTMQKATRTKPSSAWGDVNPVTGSALVAGMIPTGVSVDDRTLFVWSTSAKHSYALYNTAKDAPFGTKVDLGTKQWVQPSDDCLRIFFSAPSAANGMELSVAY
jgi:hypothetical protein